MTKFQVINNSKLSINGPELKKMVLDNIQGTIAGINTVSTILLDKLGKKHETFEDTLYILFQAVPGTVRSIEDTHSFDEFKAKRIYFNEDDYATLNATGAYYYAEKNQEVYVPYDLSDMNEDEINEFVDFVIKLIKVDIIDELANKDSWKLSKNKKLISDKVTAYIRKSVDRRVQDKEGMLREHESRLENYKAELVKVSREIPILGNEIEALKNGSVDGLDAYMKGLDTIADHPRVTNLLVKDSNVTIYVSKVVARAMVGSEEKFFYMGDMEIDIDINNAKVRFRGNEKKRSHWTSNDPHPHVSGESGKACLGNAEPMIAELSAQMEIYPLFLICLDFLSNANTADTAGKHVINWKECDKDGEILSDKKKKKTDKPALVATPENTMVTVLLDKSGTRNTHTQEWASANATFVAYDGYIGYVLNETLEEIETILNGGGVI